MIKAFHSNWTEPFFYGNHNNSYYIEDFEILTTIISALKWQEKNGDIKMITDERGGEYYKKIGIESIWNLGIDTSLDNIDKDINPEIFWAAGKLYALKQEKGPIVMIDTDFIVWNNINDILNDSNISVIHRELINSDVYPEKDYFNVGKEYKFNQEWDWTLLPCNTALTYIDDDKFKKYYVEKSIEFMKNIVKSDDKIKNMVFAEQRMISMCAKEKNVDINALLSLDELRYNGQDTYTHIW